MLGTSNKSKAINTYVRYTPILNTKNCTYRSILVVLLVQQIDIVVVVWRGVRWRDVSVEVVATYGLGSFGDYTIGRDTNTINFYNRFT